MPLDGLERYFDLLQYELRLMEAEEDLLAFAEVTMCHPRDLAKLTHTDFIVAAHHRLMARVLHRFDTEDGYNFCLSLPPRHGKSELCTRRYPSWRMGRRPDEDFAIFAYNQEKAEDYGLEIGEVLNHPRYSQIFPDFRLKKDEAKQKQTHEGGMLYLVGRGGTINGRGFHRGIVDDPIKDSDEASRELIRNKMWRWFISDVWTRRHNEGAGVGVIQTRWNMDDLIGRISDPMNAFYNRELADCFDVINVPALATDDYDELGRGPGEALWPEKFSAATLRIQQAADALTFSCLYQGNPVPEGGVLIKEEHIFEYDQKELSDVKDELRYYVTADLATATARYNDRSCILPVGVAESGVAYVLPHAFWGRKDALGIVDEIFRICTDPTPLGFYPEDGAIWKTLKPFLSKRMEEEDVFFPITPVWPSRTTGAQQMTAKAQRLTSAHARMKTGRIKFPRFAPWWNDAKMELLQFPNGSNDDFVDAVTLIGLQIDRLLQPGKVAAKKTVKEGTLAWLEAQDAQEKDSSGWMTGR